MRRQAFTLVEVLVTIAVLAVVMTLLTVPLLSSLGYVKKAKAISEAKTAALKAVDAIKSDVEEASVIFDFPVTGEGITFLTDTTDVGTGVTTQTMRRYMRVLDFPWYWGGQVAPAKWTLLQPDYVDGTKPRYEDRYSPFHKSEKAGIEPRNPYVIASYSCDWNANSAEVWNYSSPLDSPSYVPLENSMKNRTVLERMLRNDLQSITPYGAGWDIPSFVITPVRVNNETLSMDKDSAGNPRTGVVFSRNGLWAGRNQLIDEWTASAWSGWYTMDKPSFTQLYGITDPEIQQIIDKDTTAPIFAIIKSITPFYPVKSNPFGYKIKVHDKDGLLRYGTSVAGSNYKIELNRHFMDWPPIGRDEIDPNEPVDKQSKLFILKLKYIDSNGLNYEWAESHPVWTKDDIENQRIAGKLVFSQPMSPLMIKNDPVDTNYYLPIPYGWEDDATYLSVPPAKIIIWDGISEKTKQVFNYVKSSATPGRNQFIVSLPSDKYGNCKESRKISFGPDKYGNILSGSLFIWYDEPVSKAPVKPLYSICDLQPTDVVTASYSTKGQVDLMLTLARQDTAARSPEQSRQDYAVSIRIEAKNAVRRALDNR